MMFFLPDGYDEGQLGTELEEICLLSSEPSLAKNLIIYDTFDWRLYHNDFLLSQSGDVLALQRLSDGAEIGQVTTNSQPVFAWDLPNNGVSDRIAPVIEMRALLRLVEIDLHTTTYRVLNQDEKTVAWLVYEQMHFSDDGSEETVLLYLALEPVRGYQKHYNRLAGHFRDVGLPTGESQDLYFRVLAAAGRKPGDYTSKLDIQLEPEMRADEATKIVLHYLLGVMRANEPGLKDDIDTEFLHDFRVSCRRTRSALTQVKGVFPLETVERFKEDFASLGRLTNPLRDLDVYLLDEDAYRAMLPEATREDIGPLFDYLRSQRAAALQAVVDGLNGKRYERFLTDWDAFLNSEAEDHPSAPNAARPIIDLARERIYKRYRSILKSGAPLLDDASDEALHALRIECKKLRYLMEFFASLFPDQELTLLVKQLKKLQDNLGTFNDLCVHSEYLLNLANELPLEDASSRRTLVAVGGLVGSLDNEKVVVKAAFAQNFTEFASPENKALFMELFSRKEQRGRKV